MTAPPPTPTLPSYPPLETGELAKIAALNSWLAFHLEPSNASPVDPKILRDMLRLSYQLESRTLKQEQLALQREKQELDRLYMERKLALAERRLALEERRFAFKIQTTTFPSQAKDEGNDFSEKAAPPPAKTPLAIPPSSDLRPPETTAELEAMEWDLRTAFDFGDLRPFQFDTGRRLIYFPSREAHPAPPVPHYPPQFTPSPDFQPRPDGFYIENRPDSNTEALETTKLSSRRPANQTGPKRTRHAPVIVHGQVQWQRFVDPPQENAGTEPIGCP